MNCTITCLTSYEVRYSIHESTNHHLLVRRKGNAVNRVNEKQFSVNIFLIQRFLSYFDPQSSLSVLFLAKLSKFAKAIQNCTDICASPLSAPYGKF